VWAIAREAERAAFEREEEKGDFVEEGIPHHECFPFFLDFLMGSHFQLRSQTHESACRCPDFHLRFLRGFPHLYFLRHPMHREYLWILDSPQREAAVVPLHYFLKRYLSFDSNFHRYI
jgi:hypothetical protein